MPLQPVNHLVVRGILSAVPAGIRRDIDPLAPLSGGQCRDELVTVVPRAADLPKSDVKVACTNSFELWRRGWQLVIRHRLPNSRIDDSLTTLINGELFVPGWVSGHSVFESIFTVCGRDLAT